MVLTDLPRTARRLVAPIVLIIAWQLSVDLWRFGDGFIPTPTEVMQTGSIWIFGLGSNDRYAGTWLAAVTASSQRVAMGFAVASILGVIMGTMIARSQIAADVFDPILQTLRPIPVS